MVQSVLITGGAGRIATALRPLLRPTYRLRLTDVAEPTEALTGSEEFVRGNVADLAAMEQACAGMDAVLHLAGNPATTATWAEMKEANIEGTYSVYEAARRAGAHKVVFASSNHAMGFYNLEEDWPIGVAARVRPDSLYGVSKAFGEVLARYFSDAFGMSMMCLRIGWFTPREPSARRLQPLWISARDLAALVSLCLESPRKFGIYNATSNNAQRHWELQATIDDLGYAPVDDVTTLELPPDDRDVPYCDPKAGILRAVN
jgi:nucleoside-diphosphate-sugar epimerase